MTAWDELKSTITAISPDELSRLHDTSLIAAELSCAAHEQALTDAEWADKADVSPRLLTDFLYRCKDAKLDTVMRLAEAVGLQIVAVEKGGD